MKKFLSILVMKINNKYNNSVLVNKFVEIFSLVDDDNTIAKNKVKNASICL
jgi:hypothetical protein